MRITLIFSFVMILLIISCKTQEISQKSLYGTFYGLAKAKDFTRSYFLELKKDGSFSLSINVQDTNPQCNGRWEVANNCVLLQCEASDNPFAIIAGGYMGESKHTLQIIK
jgi:hypothetical protein